MNPFEGAIEVIEKRGWHQGEYMGQDGSVCTMGALYVACGVREHEKYPALDWKWDFENHCEASGRAESLSKTLRPFVGPEGIPTWNDHPDRTEAEVLETLRKAGKDWASEPH